jgi:diadenosine tetraphosphate (Ap4A) HIT family hydrolase
MTPFRLDARLAGDCHLAGDLPLSRVLLFDDCRYPWVILVPRRDGLREIHELEPADRQQLLDESCRVGRWLLATFRADKLNVAALGNLVPQLHVHHVARRVGDPAWPGPVWGHSRAEPYPADALAERLKSLRQGLELASVAI